MRPLKEPIYLFQGLRTPIGHIGGALKNFASYELGSIVTNAYLEKFSIDPQVIDGLIVGEIYTTPSYPNPARYIALENNFRFDSDGMTVSNNCTSGMEAIIEGARQLLLQENDLVMIVGQESTTNLPIWLDGVRANNATATIKKTDASRSKNERTR